MEMNYDNTYETKRNKLKKLNSQDMITNKTMFDQMIASSNSYKKYLKISNV